MPMLRCAFWLTIVYAAILSHPRATSGDTDVADAARAMAASVARTAPTDAAPLVALCAGRTGACGEAALAAARGDAGRLAALVTEAIGEPDGALATLAGKKRPASHDAGTADVPMPVPDPRRHARARLLTGAP